MIENKLCLFLLLIFGLISSGKSQLTQQKILDFKNFYGICWRGNAHENLAYAKQMGYSYVFYAQGMEKDPLSNGFYFYLETPEYLTYNRTVSFKKIYSSTDINFYNTHCAVVNISAPFPYNLATGWIFDESSFTPLLDFQQQSVISYTIDSILKLAKAIEARNPKFHFGGYAWDVPNPSGDFWGNINGKKKQTTLSHWKDGDYTIPVKGTVHNYTTYTEGHLQYYKLLFSKTLHIYPNAKFIIEPYDIFNDWIKSVQSRKDVKQFSPTIISQENNNTNFIKDVRIFQSGLVEKDNVYCTTPNTFSEAENRLYAAAAAVNGAGFGWFGRFGGTGDMPNYKSITEVPARLQLIRVLSQWENLNATPLKNRIWSGTTYMSNTAVASPDVIAIIQPFTKKIFIVFLTINGKAAIPNGKKIIGIFNTNTLFIETSKEVDNLVIKGTEVYPKNNLALNKGYIIHLQ